MSLTSELTPILDAAGWSRQSVSQFCNVLETGLSTSQVISAASDTDVALWVDQGYTRLDGNVAIGTNVAPTAASGLTVDVDITGTGSQEIAQMTLGGFLIGADSRNVARLRVGPGAASIAGSGTIATGMAEIWVKADGILLSSGTCPWAAAIYVETGPVASGATNDYAIFVDAGASRFDGGIQGEIVASPRCVHTGGVPAQATTDGTNAATNTAGTVYLAEVLVPCNMSVTGVAVFNGTAVAGDGKVMLYDKNGARVAISASTLMSGPTAYQLIPFTGAPISVVGPGTYYIGVIYDTTTHDLRGHTIGSFAAGEDAGNTYATDSTFATVTVPTTFATTTGPIASLY